MLGIFLIFCYGEFMLLLKYGGVKKKMRKNLSKLYISVVGIIVIGSIVKRVLRGYVLIHPNVV
jgi:sulfite exporter TauE/SafE